MLTKGDWGEDYLVQYKCILQVVSPKTYLEIEELQNKKETYLFVYGTLMKNNRKGKTYLDDAKFLGVCTLKGYALYDLGCFPGIVEDNDIVKGELYAISMDSFPEIDRYEGEGALYKRKIVEVYNENNERFNTYVYVYNKRTDDKVRVNYEYQPWFEGVVNKINNGNLVWYASYGSNINRERFMKYINGDKSRNKSGCSDKTAPKYERSIIFKHPIYFSNLSPSWNNKGVAFLDIQRAGKAYGKMYLITKQQFEEIHEQEGSGQNWYNEIVELGLEDGISIKTITHAPRYLDDVIPCTAYLDVIAKGIRETYLELSYNDIDSYLMERCLNRDMIYVLRYLRDQEHGTKINKICMDINEDKSSVKDSIQKLKELGLIKQDGRNIRSGVNWDSDEAIYYTICGWRTSIDMVPMEG